MTTATRPGYTVRPAARTLSPVRQGYQVLHAAFVVVPIIAGLDKFLMLLAQWSEYLSPAFASLSPFSAQGTMFVVGAVEIVAGLVVAFRPRIGGWLVAGWLGLIILNLALLGGAWDVVLRDAGLLMGAVALARLATSESPKTART